MLSTYRVNADELTDNFLKSLKYAYKGREIEIIVTDIVDDTEYLLGTESNRAHLLQGIKEIDEGVDLVTVALDSLPSV